MRKIYTLLSLYLIIGTQSLSAQDTNEYYNFTYLEEEYKQLAGATKLDLEDDEYRTLLDLGFDFNFFGKSISKIITFEEESLVYFPESKDNDIFSIMHIFENSLETIEDVSKMSYKTTGDENNRIFKLEWSHFGLYDSASSDVNMQVWIYENGNIIEFRYGRMNIANDWEYKNKKGPLVLIGTGLDLEGRTIEEAALLKGNPKNPELTTEIDLNAEPTTLDGTPANGTVYRFSPIPNSTNEALVGEISIFPNPVKDVLNISTKNIADIQINRISVLDMNGKTVITASNNDSPISIAELPTGKYMVRIETNQGICIKKIMH